MNNNLRSGFVIWFTGLSGSGKTTLAKTLESRLASKNRLIERLDGDIVRQDICKDLGYTKEDRDINIQRAAFLAKYLSRNGIIVLASFISPYRNQRAMVREEVNGFVEVYVNCSLEECERRDPKGIYKKARKGEIKNFTGIDDPYEDPVNPEIEIRTHESSVEEGVEKIMRYLRKKSFI